jgi:hypothetical protein
MFYTEIHQDITRRMESYKSWKEEKEDDALFLAIAEEEFEGESFATGLCRSAAHCLGCF